MDDNLENAAQEFERKLDDAAEQINEASDAAQHQAEDAAETLEGSWSEVKDEFQKASAETWSAPEPAESAPPTQGEADRWGSPLEAAADDPDRWSGTLYTPGADEPSGGTKAEEAPKVVDYAAATGEKPAKKESFPVWAIVLIVVLLLCLCIACPVLIFSGVLMKEFSLILTALLV